MLGARIVGGALTPGDLLPTEAELSREMGISRPSLREGLRALAAQGTASRAARGAARWSRRARSGTCWTTTCCAGCRWRRPIPAFFMDLLDVRMIIEPAAARIAASRATPEQIHAIEAAYRGMVAATPHDMEACCAHDLALHELDDHRHRQPDADPLRRGHPHRASPCVRIASSARETSYENSLSEHCAVAAAIRRRNARGGRAGDAQLLWPARSRDIAPAYDKYPARLPAAARPHGRRGARRAGVHNRGPPRSHPKEEDHEDKFLAALAGAVRRGGAALAVAPAAPRRRPRSR